MAREGRLFTINLCFEFHLLLCNNPICIFTRYGNNDMTRDEIQSEVLRVFKEQFEITSPDLDENLREAYEFDSIDAIELLREIEALARDAIDPGGKKNGHGYPNHQSDSGLY